MAKETSASGPPSLGAPSLGPPEAPVSPEAPPGASQAPGCVAHPGPPSLDWPGLLKWSLTYNDGTRPTQARSPADLAFLTAAIKEATKNMNAPVDMVKDSVAHLSSDRPDEEVLSAVSIVCECQDVDPEISRLLIRLGVIDPLLNCLTRHNKSIVEKTLDIFTFALPHNLELQTYVWKNGGLDLFSKKLKEEIETKYKIIAAEKSSAGKLTSAGETANAGEATANAGETANYETANAGDTGANNESNESRLRVKYLGCISGLIRHIPESEKEFVDKGGLSLVVWCLGVGSSDPKLATKAATLLRHLIIEGRISESEYHKRKITDTTATLYECETLADADNMYSIQLGESAAELLDAIVTQKKLGIDSTNFMGIVEKRLKAIQSQPRIKLESEILNKLKNQSQNQSQNE